jgi:hypothetical protein
MKFLVSILILFFSNVSMAQKYGNVWHFGNEAGIDFNGCDPVALTMGQNAGFEGCAAISDQNGQLLFYTNSDQVWTDQHVVMPNGSLVSGGGSLSQVLIINDPGSLHQYYIFTTKLQANGNLSLQYHIVDMSLNNGHGDVISKNNILSTLNITEQVAATGHANSGNIWVTTHEYGTNNFLTFEVTPTGITPTPVISAVGPIHFPCTSNMNARGEIKFSPDGTRLAFNGNGTGNISQSNILTVFDFDNATGAVSNPIDLPFSGGEWGLSFSPDNSKLYGATWKAFNFPMGSFNYVYQFDLSSNNPTTIINSKVILDSVPTPGTFGSIKIGPNGKIYIARPTSLFLAVINEPNLAGTACNYMRNGFALGGKTSMYGLNNYIEYIDYCLPSGISDAGNYESPVQISQNPFFNHTTVTLPGISRSGYTLYLYDVTGKRVRTVNGDENGNFYIERNELPPAVYFFSIENRTSRLASGKIAAQ